MSSSIPTLLSSASSPTPSSTPSPTPSSTPSSPPTCARCREPLADGEEGGCVCIDWDATLCSECVVSTCNGCDSVVCADCHETCKVCAKLYCRNCFANDGQCGLCTPIVSLIEGVDEA